MISNVPFLHLETPVRFTVPVGGRMHCLCESSLNLYALAEI